MHSKRKGKRKLFSVFLSLLMVFTMLMPSFSTISADAIEAETMPTVDEEDYQIIDIPVVKGGQKSLPPKDTQTKPIRAFSLMAQDVTGTVYGQVYSLGGWESVDCNFGNFDYPGTIAEAPVMLWTDEDFAVNEEGIGLSITLKNEDGEVIIDDYNIETKVVDGQLRIMGLAKNLKPGTYEVTLTAQVGYETYEFETIEQTYFYRISQWDTSYMSLNAPHFFIGLDGINPRYADNNQFIIEIVDEEGNTVATSSNEVEAPRADYNGSRSYDVFEDVLNEYWIHGLLFKSGAIAAESKYELKLYSKSLSQENYDEVKLPAPIYVEFTDSPIIDNIEIYRSWEDPLVQGDRTFEILTYVRNSKNKNIIKLEMIDSKGDIIATSADSSYGYINELEKFMEIVYTMNVLDGKNILNNETYRIRVKYAGTGMINQAEGAEIHTDPRPMITEVITDYADKGELTIKAVNLNVGQEYDIRLWRDIYQNETYESIEYKASAKYNSNGTLTVRFKDENSEIIPLVPGYYNVSIFDTSVIYMRVANISFDIRGGQEIYNFYINWPHIVSTNATSYWPDIEINGEFGSMPLDTTLLNIELLDINKNKVGEVDNSSIEIIYSDFNYNGIQCEMKLKDNLGNPKTLEIGEYSYRITYAGKEIAPQMIEDNWIEATDRVFAGGMQVKEEISTRIAENVEDPHQYRRRYISTAEKALNIEIFNITNSKNAEDSFSLELCKITYDTEGEKLEKIAECSPEDIKVDTYGNSTKHITAVMNLNPSTPDGKYFVVVKCNGERFYRQPVEFTSMVGIGGFSWDREIRPGESELWFYLYNTINIDAAKLSADVKTVDGKDIEANFDVENINKYGYGDLEIALKTDSPLAEGCYLVSIYHDQVKLQEYEWNSGWSRLLTVTSVPFTQGYGKWWNDETDRIEEYRIYTVNYDKELNYKGYLYLAEKDTTHYEEESKLMVEINFGKLNDNGQLVIKDADMPNIPSGRYRVIIEAEDGTIMGDVEGFNYVNQYDKPIEIKEPKVSINKGALYTNSKNVKLTINAPDYSTVKIAHTEAELADKQYKLLSAEMPWELQVGDGLKTVFLKFKTADGKESKVIKAEIYLDETPPAKPESAMIKDGEGKEVTELLKNSQVQLYAVGAEKAVKAFARILDESGNTIDNIRLGYLKEDNGKAVFATWINLSEAFIDAKKAVFFFEDFAGNMSDEVEKDISVTVLAKIYGVVEKGGERVRYQSVLLQKKEGEEYKDYSWAYADGEGYFIFDNIPNGDYKLFSYAPRGYENGEVEFKVENLKDVEQDLIFADKYSARGNLTIIVKDTDGKTVEGAYLSIANWYIGEYLSAVTGAYGSCTFSGIPTITEGMNYSISLSYKAHYKWQEVTVKETNEDITITVPAMGNIKGKVVDKDGNSIENVYIYAVGTKGSYGWARTDSDGKYTMEVPKDDEKYTVYVYTDNSTTLVGNRRYSDVVPGVEDKDFILYDKIAVSGVVKGLNGENIKTTVYATGIDTWSWDRVNSDTNGSFKFGKVFGAGLYRFDIWEARYYSKAIERTITEAELEEQKTIDLGNIDLEPYGRDIFDGDLNNVRTDVSYVQKGNNITARVNYHNTKNESLSNVTIKAVIPKGTSLISGSLEKQIAKLMANEKGELTFTIKVGEDFEGSKVTIKASGICSGKESPIGYADVDVVTATINAPSEVEPNATFKVYGEATIGSEITIIARNNADGTEKIIAIAKPNGRWYYADVKGGIGEGDYKLYAKVTKGNDTGLSDYTDIAVKADALAIEDIIITSPGGQKIGVNEETGVAAFSVWVDMQYNGKPIDVQVKFNKGDIPGHYEFAGNVFDAAEFDNGYMTDLLKGWKGTGIQKLYYVTDDDKVFVIAEITILIDPSGYVYDKYTGERIEGATVTCEIKNDKGNWAKWDAALYGQVNPQLTDDEGKYGWMVPDGEYRIKVQKDGYEAYVTTDDENANIKNIVIPPPRMDVNIGLINISNPMVSYTIPENGKTAAVDSQIAIVFNKPMDTTTINSNTLKVTDDEGKAVTGTISFTDNDTRAVFKPAAPFAHGKLYNVLLSGIKDKEGRKTNSRTLGDYGFSFTASQDIKTDYLKITNVEPANGATNIEKNAVIKVTFDKELSLQSVTDKTVRLETSGQTVKSQLNVDNNIITLTPYNDLMSSTNYKIILKSDVKSTDGDYLEKDMEYTFTTKYYGGGGTTPGGGGGKTGGGGGSSSGGGGGTPPPADTTASKVDEAIAKGGKDVTLAVSSNGSVELSKASIEKLIKNNINVTLQNGNIKTTIDIASLKDELLKASKVSFVLNEKSADTITASGYKKLGSTFEIKLLTDGKEIKAGKKVTIKIDLGSMPKNLSSRLKAGIYRKVGNSLEYVPGGHLSKNGVVSFRTDSFGEFVIAEYSKKFNDMDNYSWASDFVEILAARQITSGIGDNKFAPEGTVTRAQFAAFVARALGLEAKSSTNPFSDVKGGQWFAEAVIAAAESGIIQGDGKGNFMPDQVVTREQMAVMIMRAYEFRMGKYKAAAADFADMDNVSSFAKEGVLAAKDLDIISGTGSGNFDPKGQAVRAAAAKMIVKLLELVTE